MYPVQVFFLLSFLVILPLAWLGGGHTERAGVAMLLPAYIISYMVQRLRIGDLMWGAALIDLILLIGLVWLALTRDRWWPLVAAAFQTMSVLLYFGQVLLPDLTSRSVVISGWILGLISLYTLVGGVVERILAGEPPASRSAIWKRVRPPTA